MLALIIIVGAVCWNGARTSPYCCGSASSVNELIEKGELGSSVRGK